MTQVRSDIDLGGLARAPQTVPPPKRSWLRIVVPLVIVLAFLAILATSLGDLWRGSVEVTVVRPIAIDASQGAAAGVPLFQAAGWIEPDPSAIEVSALASGVVREVLVQPSDRVASGDVVARLIDQDARLACDAALAMLGQAKAELTRAEKESGAARASFEAALTVTENLAVGRAEFDGKSAESRHRASAVQRGEAAVKVAEQELALQQELVAAGAAGPRQIDLADARLAGARAELAILSADAALAAAEAEKAQARLARAQRDVELRIDDQLRLDTALAEVELAKAKVLGVQVSCDEAQLRLKRMEVLAPADGIVLERSASPGSTLSTDEALVCTLYDPAQLRVRVDVPQGEIGKLSVGQRAEVLAESRPGKPYRGEVSRVVHRADIQKVTLQAHVKLEDADTLLRPEMLCQVRFLSTGATPSSSNTQRVRIPARFVVDGDSAWIVGADQTAVLRELELGAKVGDDVEVLAGLNLSDKLIDGGREGLRDGARVKIREVL